MKVYYKYSRAMVLLTGTEIHVLINRSIIKLIPTIFPIAKQLTTNDQFYVATEKKIESAIICPKRSYRQVIKPPFQIIKLEEFCKGFSQIQIFSSPTVFGSTEMTICSEAAALGFYTGLNSFTDQDQAYYHSFRYRDASTIHTCIQFTVQ